MFLPIWGLVLLAAPLFAQHYPILPVAGSPNNIIVLFQDSKSRLWIGTDEDLICFDGTHFFSMRAYGFPKETPRSITEDDEGGIWLITDGGFQYGGTGSGGVYRYRDGRVKKMFSGGGLLLASMAPGVIVASLQRTNQFENEDLHLFRRQGSQWSDQLLLEKAVFSIGLDPQGSLLFGCNGGWCEFTRQQIVDWPNRGTDPIRHQIPGLTDRLSKILRDKFGCVWARTGSVGWSGCGANGHLSRLPASFIPANDYSILQESPDGKILSLGLSSLVYGRLDSFMRAGAANGVPNDLSSALIARDGTIWLGSASGLYRFQYPFYLEYWNQDNGVEYPNSILRVGNRMLLGSSGVETLDPNSRQWSLLPGTEAFGTVMALAPGHGDTVYAAATGHGVSQLTPEGEIVASSSTEHRGLSLGTDTEGQLWLGGKGIYRVAKRGRLLNLALENLGVDSVMAIKLDAAHETLWACNWQELLAHRNGSWRHLTVKDGLDGLRTNFCQTLAVHPDGDVWVSYAGLAQFSVLKNATSSRLTVRDYKSGGDIGDAHTSFLDVDSRGWLWRGSDADYVASEKAAEAGDWLRLSSQDGIPIPGGNANAFFGDPDGSVWFGSANTIVHFKPPDGFATQFPTPEIFISGFSVGKAAPMPAEMTSGIPHGQDLVVHIGSLQFDRRNALRLRYRLLPEQSSWQQGRSLDLHLGKLGWGRHTLQVQAQLSTGSWSKVSERKFTVLRPVWLSWPALGGFAAALGVAIASVRRWRKTLRERAGKMLPELAEWRLEALSPELYKLKGKRLDHRFEVGQLLARGGFANVFEGRDLQQGGMACAIKIFRQELLDKEWMERRFQQEVAALERVHHSNVVEIYGSGRIPDDAFYLVMEFIEGTTLRNRLEEIRLAPKQIAEYMRQAGSALQAIHAQDICHRDLKPENMMIRSRYSRSDELVLIDFSIAIVKDPDETMHGLSRAAGTLHYMAPEQAIGYADGSSDIYSLAKILIEMLAGKRLSLLLPDAAMDLPERVRELLGGLPVRLPPASIDMIALALEFDPMRRPKDAYEFGARIAEDLEATANGEA
ncbi:MAG: protein kinase [Edaphobacter sp.]